MLACFGLPGSKARSEAIIELARATHGYVAADLERLCREAVYLALRRAGVQSAEGDTEQRGAGAATAEQVTLLDFHAALVAQPPSSLLADPAHVPAQPPEHGIEALGGLEAAWQRLRVSVAEPLRLGHARPGGNGPAAAEDAALRWTLATLGALGIPVPRGAVLHGPTGSGKTALALALARELQGSARFLNVPCTSLVQAEVGRSEKQLSAIFAAARAAGPCLILLDQIDAIAPRRAPSEAHTRGGGDQSGGGGQSTENTMDRLLSLLLVEIDGAESGTLGGGHGRVVVVATTHDLALVEPALLRPGRLDQHIKLELPDLAARRDILTKLLSKIPVFSGAGAVETQPMTNQAQEHAQAHVQAHTVRVASMGILSSEEASQAAIAAWLAEQTAGWTGADLSQLCQEAGMACLRRNLNASAVTAADFMQVLRSKATASRDSLF